MGLYKWFFKKVTGIELVDPDPNFVPEANDAEIYLDKSDNWPKSVSGVFYLIDSSGDDEHEFYWAIGELEIPDFKCSVLIEFNDQILIESGLSKNEDFPSLINIKPNKLLKLTVNTSHFLCVRSAHFRTKSGMC